MLNQHLCIPLSLQVVYSKLTDLLPSAVTSEDDPELQRPSMEEIEDTTEKTRQALEKLTQVRYIFFFIWTSLLQTWPAIAVWLELFSQEKSKGKGNEWQMQWRKSKDVNGHASYRFMKVDIPSLVLLSSFPSPNSSFHICRVKSHQPCQWDVQKSKPQHSTSGTHHHSKGCHSTLEPHKEWFVWWSSQKTPWNPQSSSTFGDKTL